MVSFFLCRSRCNSRHNRDGESNIQKRNEIWKTPIDTAEIHFPILAAADTNCSTRRNVNLSEDLYKAQEAVLAPARINCSTTWKVLDQSRKEWCLKNISINESHQQVIANVRQASGYVDAMKDTGNKLQESNDMYEEVLCPKLWWDCIYCTYRNSPALHKCKICESKKPIETTNEMFFNHKALLYNRIDVHRGKECLSTCHDKEESEVSIKELKLEDGEHLEEHTTLIVRLNDLENNNNNMMLSDNIMEAKLKTTDLSAVDLKVAQKDERKSHEAEDSNSYLISGKSGKDDLCNCSDEEWDEDVSWEMSEEYELF